ncbi:sensor histidine kinase [Chryseobacterium nematophagum]|uniref:Sensor histidine kinase n=1 Tax=Chryseobacterium nematophagum TaxID=2305228 RepID=A0A3M7TII2_9FLAO|nr:HAMP domain-containing sensor histidine kinase [Chryseobacterium nematophagum]RNA63341.1 sensor histidine kinase [Chryseobacterium nematophagum]
MPNDIKGYLLNAHTFLEDKKSNLWISSNNGLFKVSKNKLLRYSKDKKIQVNYFRYNTEHGLLNNEFNGATPSANILEDGDFVFPSMEGFVFFRPDKTKSNFPTSNQIFVERAEIDNKLTHFKNKLSVNSDYKFLIIFIDIPYYYDDLENIYLQAKVENSKNSNWEFVNKDRRYFINKLPPGKYNLLVRFITSEEGNFVYKKIAIEIEPKFYETVLFQVFIVLLGIGSILLFIKHRTNFLNNQLKATTNNLTTVQDRLKNEEEYQHKLVESISHDIATPVRFINILAQQLHEANDPQAQKKYFEGIYNSSKQLYNFTSSLKSYIDLYKENYSIAEKEYELYDLIQEKVLLFHSIAERNGTVIENNCSKNIMVKIHRDIVGVIIHNIIDNAVKHTVRGEIVISAKFQNHEVEIEIKDNGIGMSVQQMDYYSRILQHTTPNEELELKNYGLGLQMVIKLIKKINSKISFLKNSPKGTLVKIHLKKTE